MPPKQLIPGLTMEWYLWTCIQRGEPPMPLAILFLEGKLSWEAFGEEVLRASNRMTY